MLWYVDIFLSPLISSFFIHSIVYTLHSCQYITYSKMFHWHAYKLLRFTVTFDFTTIWLEVYVSEYIKCNKLNQFITAHRLLHSNVERPWNVIELLLDSRLISIFGDIMHTWKLTNTRTYAVIVSTVDSFLQRIDTDVTFLYHLMWIFTCLSSQFKISSKMPFLLGWHSLPNFTNSQIFSRTSHFFHI